MSEYSAKLRANGLRIGGEVGSLLVDAADKLFELEKLNPNGYDVEAYRTDADRRVAEAHAAQPQAVTDEERLDSLVRAGLACDSAISVYIEEAGVPEAYFYRFVEAVIQEYNSVSA